MSLLLINPPIVKPCEPPAGLAYLAGALHAHSLPYTVLDANIEGILHIVGRPAISGDTWTRRAGRHVQRNLDALRDRRTFENIDRYKRAVIDVNRILQVNTEAGGSRVTLSNFQDAFRSPLRSADLMENFTQYEKNPFFSYFQERLQPLLERIRPSMVGFSLNYLSQALCTFAMMGYLRHLHPQVKIILGGGLVNSWMKSPAWADPFREIVDHCIAGPGEGPLFGILGKEPPVRRSAPRYDDFPISSYLSPGFILPYSASRGCYWRQCSFCPEQAEGNPFDPVPPPQVVSDLRRLAEKTSPALIHLLDNAIPPALLNVLADTHPGAPWFGFARISDIPADLEFCRSLKNSGCVMLKLGVESGSQEVLDAMNKGIDLRKASAVLRNLSRAGIATYVYLLFGTPPESISEARETLAFTERHGDVIDFLNLAVFNLPAYGPDAGVLRSDDFYEGDLTLYRRFSHPRGWDRPLVRKFLDTEFKNHPAVAKILRRDPPFFSSNHAPFIKHTN